jgi:hypothetical protein
MTEKGAIRRRSASASNRRNFAVFARVASGIGALEEIPVFFHLWWSVQNPVVIRRPLDKFCLEKGQYHFAKRASQDSARRGSKSCVVPVKKNGLLRSKPGWKISTKS